MFQIFCFIYIYTCIYFKKMQDAGLLLGGLVMQIMRHGYSKQDAQDEMFCLKVRRKQRDQVRGSIYKSNVKVHETFVRWVLQEMFHELFKSARPTWCYNPRSKRLLENDCYSEKPKLCVEVDEIHHSVYREHWHKS